MTMAEIMKKKVVKFLTLIRVVIGVVMVIVLATGPKDRGITPGQEQYTFNSDKNP
jgi:hypothetical protein